MSDIKKPFHHIDRAAHFFARARDMHSNRFDYSSFEYVDAKTKGLIRCPDHGEFHQTPDKHLARRSKGCPACWAVMRIGVTYTKPRKPKPVMTAEAYLKRARAKYGGRYEYDLSEFLGLVDSTIGVICPTHGRFEVKASNHVQRNNRYGCAKCGQRATAQAKIQPFEAFVAEARTLHGERYQYPPSCPISFETRRSKLTIKCEKHGDFIMSAQKHLSGQRCRDCAFDDMIEDDVLIGGYSERLFEDRPDLKHHPAYLYCLEIDDGRLYKVGITRISIGDRIKALRSAAKGEIKTIREVASIALPLYEAFVREQAILARNRNSRKPQFWSTETFELDIRAQVCQTGDMIRINVTP